MKKAFYLYIVLSCVAYHSKADHITGGEIYYTLKSIEGNQYTYNVTVKMFMDCKSYRQFYNPTFVSVFDRQNGARIRDLSVPITNIEVINLTENDDCVANPPQVCHRIGYYNFDLTLPASFYGYVLTTEVFFRVNNMHNLTPGYENIGATYTAEIPGTYNVPTGPSNNSARFTGDDLVIICAGNEFTYSFSAEDKDGDELDYSLCYAYKSDNFMFGIDVIPPVPPPYNSVPYGSEFSGGRPLGINASINEETGVISGIAPAPGTYVIAVCVQEHRNGKYIATQRKDLQINIAACTITAASLADTYLLCGDTKNIYLENQSLSSLVDTYNWRITDNQGASIYTSTSPTVNYSFADTGLYKVKLTIDAGGKCADSAESVIRVYPGFKPGFSFDGICINKPTQFTDTTSSVYGTINSWSWDLTGDLVGNDLSGEQNPEYTYSSSGNKAVSLIVTDSKGCMDTAYKTIEIIDKPFIGLSFTDTLICKPDTLQLFASGTGIYSWSSAGSIENPATASPTVMPVNTTIYYVDLDLDGCVNRDSVTVNVVDHVTLKTMEDTTICGGDAIQLNIFSDGLQYNWSPASPLNDPKLQQPVATTITSTKYTVTANIGNCTATGAINITAVPYPVALAGRDTIICFGTTAFLNAQTDGSIFNWAPPINLLNSNALNTTATPLGTTTYIFIAYDIKGCPKPGVDSVTITVLPEIKAFAGNDTAVVINQPLQMNGSGGTSYQWVPATGLSSSIIPDPIALFYYPSDGNRYKLIVSNQAGCSDSAFVTVKVYKTLPSVFVPTGFTPNRDGRNDVLKPILAGMQRIDAFNIYNRLGQLIFSTKTEGMGWDGTLNGQIQSPGAYVWMVRAVDYNGRPYFKKGTVILIR